jgi:NADP-dependent 3-hydroxy acid dehydrogenase YdfG
MIFGKSVVAVVSGGASGLGAATARKFASMGLHVGILTSTWLGVKP